MVLSALMLKDKADFSLSCPEVFMAGKGLSLFEEKDEGGAKKAYISESPLGFCLSPGLFACPLLCW